MKRDGIKASLVGKTLVSQTNTAYNNYKLILDDVYLDTSRNEYSLIGHASKGEKMAVVLSPAHVEELIAQRTLTVPLFDGEGAMQTFILMDKSNRRTSF